MSEKSYWSHECRHCGTTLEPYDSEGRKVVAEACKCGVIRVLHQIGNDDRTVSPRKP